MAGLASPRPSGGRSKGRKPAEPLRGRGRAADGKVAAVVVAGGRVEKLHVDPQLMRLGSEELCGLITKAVNAAMSNLRAKTAKAGAGTMDPGALASALEILQAESVRQMNRISQGVAETVAKIQEAADGASSDR
ncbi:YbaB/EbfC family nucleoid-associated protein [Actinoallomurus sp. CA-150999]|uniref:YbaB/EbfC family nucleoid-associated protein n=1 Tax=Actinoallomurus sp. CA-150999 TaxID=3239887 RepID=UPI003D8AF168